MESLLFNFVGTLIPGIPDILIYIWTFIFGAAVGSFLNVCIYRIPEEDLSLWNPPNSRCPVCKNPIKWYDNIPILSYILLGGKCRNCKSKISLQYPLVELIAGIMAVAVVKSWGFNVTSLVLFIFISALIVITFIDLSYWIIPDVISLPAIPLGIAASYFLGPPLPSWTDAVWGAVLGGGSFWLISVLYELFTKRPGLGLGDAKLLAMLGAFLGWRYLPLVVLLASAQGLIAALILYAFGWREGAPDFEDEEAGETSDKPEKSEVGVESGSVEGSVGVGDTEGGGKAEREGTSEVGVESGSVEDSVGSEKSEVGGESGSVEGSVGVGDTEGGGKAERVGASEGVEGSDKVGSKGDSSGISSEEGEEEEISLRRIAIPFGPFLALGAIEVLFWGELIYSYIARLTVE